MSVGMGGLAWAARVSPYAVFRLENTRRIRASGIREEAQASMMAWRLLPEMFFPSD